MHTHSTAGIVSVIMMLVITACAVTAPAPTAVSPAATFTITASPNPSVTPLPTSTSRPSATPNFELTQQAEEFQASLTRFVEQGYILSAAGQTTRMPAFTNHWVGLGTYNYWPLKDSYTDLVFSAHFEWSTSSSAADAAGCGVSFGIQENGNRYTAVVDRERIIFSYIKGKTITPIGAAYGSGLTGGIPLPAKIDFVLIVRGQSVYVAVDNKFREYTLSAERTSAGEFAYAILAGTNFGEGTTCEMTNINIWIPN